MPKRPTHAQARAAVDAGDPPQSADYPTDDSWHDAQDDWLARWDGGVLPDGPERRRQWEARKRKHSGRVAAAAGMGDSSEPPRKRAKKVVVKVSSRKRVLAGPPKLPKPSLPPADADEDDQLAYALAAGMHGLARDAQRKLPRRTKAENAQRMQDQRQATAETANACGTDSGVSSADQVAAQERLRRERERSQRRRNEVAQQAVRAAAAEHESDGMQARLTEQQMLLAAIDEVVKNFKTFRSQWDCMRYYDERLCCDLKTWAARNPADGTLDWEDDFMDRAIDLATLRVSGGPSPAHAYRRVGPLQTLRWLLPGLSFADRAGALDPDPVMTVAERARHGHCVCGCRLPPSHRLSEADVAMGGMSREDYDNGNGAVPWCFVHNCRLSPKALRGY